MTTLPLAIANGLVTSLRIPAKLLDDLRNLHMCQWNLEDQTRLFGTDDRLAKAKRDIDASNSRRHKLINAIDSTINASPRSRPARWYAETVGELCDRLLILDLKYQALADPASVHSVCQHLQIIAAQLIRDVDAGCAVLPPRLGVKIYNGTVEEGTHP